MGLLDLIFPKNCLECGRTGGYICEDCLVKVGRGKASRYSISLFAYEGVIRKAIIALKYKFASDVARELAEACVLQLIRNSYFVIHNSIALIPIPLHKRRENWRGFNQSEEVGQLIAEKMGWQFRPRFLVRKINTVPQVGLKGKVRHKNIKNVFGLNSAHQSLVTNHQSLIVFDDVYTTGSTIREAIKVLKRAGFSTVFGLTIAS